MADPLTALGLASNIVQLITFASSLVSKTREISKSANGALVANLELEAIASNLQELSRESEGRDPVRRVMHGQQRGLRPRDILKNFAKAARWCQDSS
jgi:hypothetical protein